MSWNNKHPAHKTGEVPQTVRDFCWDRDDGLCQLGWAGCTVVAQELDHIIGIAEAGRRFDEPSNLRWVCRACHKLRTQQQRWPKLGRQPERHPGIRWERVEDASQAEKSGFNDGTQQGSGGIRSGP